MNPGDYGAFEGEEQQAVVPSFVGSVVTRRWFEVGRNGVIEAPFRLNSYYQPKGDPNEPYHSVCNTFSHIFGMDADLFRSLDLQHGFDANCSCGFYSFYEQPRRQDIATGTTDYARRLYVGGVVENYGRIVYGDLGLRSEKMRIKALVLFSNKPGAKDWWRSLRNQGALNIWVAYWAIYAVIYAISWTQDKSNTSLIGAGIAVFCFMFLTFGLYLWGAFRIKTRCVDHDEIAFTMLKQNYPYLPIYNSWEEAAKDFPHTERRDLP